VRSAGDVVRIVTEHLRPGQAATFTVYRGGKRLQTPVTLVDRPADPNQGP
jgi:S1-C subfamily serine protease